MDELDAAMVALLQKDGRITNRDLASKLKIAPSTCLERLRGLRESGVITGFHAETDMLSLGREVQAMISVSLRPQSREIIEAFRNYVLAQPETIAVFVVTGDDDMLIHVGIASTRDLQDFVLDRLAKHSEISGFKTSVVYQHHRKTSLPPLAGGPWPARRAVRRQPSNRS